MEADRGRGRETRRKSGDTARKTSKRPSPLLFPVLLG